MRLKTFLAAYMLFLCIIFVSVGVVSHHMTRSTTHMLREKSAREFQTIRTSLGLDIAARYARFPGGRDFYIAVDQVFEVYEFYYRRNGIDLALTHTENSHTHDYARITFLRENGGHFVLVTSIMPDPFGYFTLSYTLDITANITDLQQIQRFLWVTTMVVSLVAAVFLYAILLKIFNPLEIVAQASWQIAEGQYSERITIKGQNELASMATAFNRMAAQIESQISQLEEEANRKQQFVDNFAHEIRTPLTSIFGYAELLQKANINEAELIESSGYIMSEAGHMKKVANSLLELATLRDYMPNILPIYIPELFEDIKKSLEKLFTERGVKLHCQSFAYSLHGQDDLIKTLLLNLCTNAAMACETGKGVVFLTSDKEDDRVMLTVSDNGCGIPNDKLTKITEPFYRVDRARSRSDGGAGLGLSLCKQIVDVHGATMEITSPPGCGTTVKITFTSP